MEPGAVGGQRSRPRTYYSWVRHSARQSTRGRAEPVADFREQLLALCRDVNDRVEAVQQAVDAGLATTAAPAVSCRGTSMAPAATGSMYASPSRDARLKAAFRELHETVAAALSPERPAAPHAARRVDYRPSAQPELSFRTYRNSARKSPVERLPWKIVLERLFSLSFDAYHCPELRWGAPPGSAGSGELHRGRHQARLLQPSEQRLRNRIDRDYGAAYAAQPKGPSRARLTSTCVASCHHNKINEVQCSPKLNHGENPMKPILILYASREDIRIALRATSPTCSKKKGCRCKSMMRSR